MQHSRRRSRRMLVGAALATVAALTLAACSSGDSGGGSGDSKSLTMWTFKQPHVKALEAAAAAFKKKTGISVSIKAVTPETSFQTKVQAAAQSGDLPDVMEVHSDGEDRTFGGSGVTQDLTSILPKSISDNYQDAVKDAGIITAQQVKNSKAPSATDAGIAEGARYAVPFTIGTFGIFYADKKKLAAVGITEAPKTWEEFISDVKKTTAKDPQSGGISLGFQAISVGINWVLNPLAFGTLGKDDFDALYGKDTGKDWGSANGKKALDLYSQLDGLWMPGTQTVTIDDGDLSLVQGKSTWDVGGTFTLAFLQQNGMDPSNILAFPIPAPEGAKVPDLKLAPIALTSLAISKDAKDKATASKWIEYLSSPSVAAKFAVDAVDLPAANLGADASSSLGENLTTLTKVFDGTPETAYNPNAASAAAPPGFDLDEAGKIVASLSPLGETDVNGAASKLSTLIQNYYQAAK